MPRGPFALLIAITLSVVTSCRDEAVGVGDPDGGPGLDASTPAPDAAPDERCQDWTPPPPGALGVWSSDVGSGARYAAAAVGNDGTLLAVWATVDQLFMADWGARAHYPRIAGYPDGGFLLLLSPDESHPDEDVLFTMLDR